MRIALVYPSYWPYVRRGVERYCHDLAGYLTRTGHQVDVITSKPGRTRQIDQQGVRTLYLAQVNHPVFSSIHPLFRFYSFGLSCLPALLDGRYDVIHTWTYPHGLALRLTGLLRGTPYLYHTVVTLPHLPGPYYLPPGPDRWVFERTIAGAAAVAVLNRTAARDLQTGWGRPAVVLPAPVDVQAFHPVVPRDRERPRVLFTSDLSDPRKGGILLLRAWNFVYQRRPDATLVLAGPLGHAVGQAGLDLPALIPWLVNQPARGTIEVLGPGRLKALPSLYAGAAVTVLPSIDEPFGMVLTESLACGTPVVCGQDGGPGEIVSDPAIGTTIPLRSAQDLYSMTRALELAEAILRTIDLAEQPGIVQRCRAHAMQWSLDTVGEQVVATYDRIAASARTRA